METQIGCLPVSFYQRFLNGEWTIPGWASLAKSLGLDYIDVNAMFFEGISVEELSKTREALVLPVVMVSAYSDFTHPDAEVRRREVEKTVKCFASCRAVGARYVRLTAGQLHPGRKDADAIRDVYACFSACLRPAEESDLTILLENHSKPGAWQYNDFNFHRERFLSLWDKLKELPVSINFDTANAWALGDWEELLDAVSGRVATLHINDLSSISPLAFCCAGEGLVDIEAMLRAAFRNGFQGPVTIEEASFDGEAGLRRAVLNTKKLIQAARRV